MKMTDEDRLIAKAQIQAEPAPSDRKAEVRTRRNTIYKILKRCVGKENRMIADNIAAVASKELCTEVNRGHVNETVRLLNEKQALPGLCSSRKGYYISTELPDMLNCLHFLLTKCLTMKRNITSVYEMIIQKHGINAIPDDMYNIIDELNNMTNLNDEPVSNDDSWQE